MIKYRLYSSYLLYISSLTIIIITGVYVIWGSKNFIFAGKGIGVYGALIYYAAAFVGVILWALSYWLDHNKKLTTIFWVIFLIFTIFIAFQPTWWAAPSIS